jgi:hypothetical protein
VGNVASRQFSPTTYSPVSKFIYTVTETMRPQVEEVEDDLAAEEENKLINEVCRRVLRHLMLNTPAFHRNTKPGETHLPPLCSVET